MADTREKPIVHSSFASESGSFEKQSSSDVSATVSQDSEEDYPDGGRDAVLTVIGASLVQLVQWGVISVAAVLLAQ